MITLLLFTGNNKKEILSNCFEKKCKLVKVSTPLWEHCLCYHEPKWSSHAKTRPRNENGFTFFFLPCARFLKLLHPLYMIIFLPRVV